MNVTKGAYTALITPFLEPEGGIDFKSLEKLVDIQIENRLGIVALGTTAETPTLNDKEKKRIIKLIIEKAKEKVPIIVGTGTNATITTIEETKIAQDFGADAVLIVTPYYNKPTQEGIFRHFESISKNTDIPVIIYNISGRTGTNIETSTLKNISQLEKIIGVKEASGNINQMMDVIYNLSSNFFVFSGDDSLTLPLLSFGGHGVISVVSNIYPNEVKNMVDYFMNGEYDFARDIHYKLLPFTRAIFKETNPIGIKYAMFLKDLIEEAYRLPICEMTDGNKNLVKEALLE